MNWRATQLGTTLCDQDHLLLNLIANRPVRIHGDHCGFDQFCKIDSNSDFCLIFFNRPLWLSEIKNLCADYLEISTRYLYIGINRYQIKGNDTLHCDSTPTNTFSDEILNWMSACLKDQKFLIKQQGYFEKDQGRYFNFVQPLTWIYGEHETNQD